MATSLVHEGHALPREIAGLGACHVDASGTFRLARGSFANERAVGAAGQPAHPFFDLSRQARAAARLTDVRTLDYLILVPTLRCNLSCSYCQVSRAPIDRPNFDWTEGTLEHVVALLGGLETEHIKIEFQGGEPTLRLDLIESVIRAADRFVTKQFVICTNLAHLSDDLLALLENPDVLLSTSLDGLEAIHTRQRTGSETATSQFLTNAEAVIDRFGAGKLSALPTIDPTRPPEPDELINAYMKLQQTEIFLRPINYQGFARKRFAEARDTQASWWDYYERFVHCMIVRNYEDRSVVFRETYLSVCLSRIFQVGHDRHVDLRNPNPVGVDYVVIDYDGKVYPTDEARMLSRSGVIDLAIGDVASGWNTPTRALLDRHSTNIGDPACDRCAYQPFCGRDLIDDLSRYGTIDKPRHETFFCQKHQWMFDFCMRLIYDDDPAVRYSLAKWVGLAGETFPAMAEVA